MRLPAQAARHLPDLSTTLRVDSPPLMIRAFGAHCHLLHWSCFIHLNGGNLIVSWPEDINLK
jgi:hypothetical protein